MRARIAFGLILALASPIRSDDDLQGTWTLAEHTAGGRSMDRVNDDITATIRGDKIELNSGKNKVSEKYHVVLDSTVTPKAIDWHKSDANGKRGDKMGEGIFEIDGDKLRICLKLRSEPPWNRPTAMQSTEEGGEILMVFRREPRAK
jgi:uncharacterized protein (TIGR03067 family)